MIESILWSVSYLHHLIWQLYRKLIGDRIVRFKMRSKKFLYAVERGYTLFRLFNADQQQLIVEDLKRKPFVQDNTVRSSFEENTARMIAKQKAEMQAEGVDYDEFVRTMYDIPEEQAKKYMKIIMDKFNKGEKNAS